MQANLFNLINIINLVNSSSDLPLPTSSCVTAPSNAMESKDGWLCLTGGSNETYGLNNSCVVVNSDNHPSYHCLNESSWCVTEGEGESCYPIDNEFRHDFSVPEDVCEYIKDGSWWICSQPTADNSYSLIGGNYTCDATGTVETVEMDNGECSKTPSPSPDDGSSDDDLWAELGKIVGYVAGVSVGAIILCTLCCKICCSEDEYSQFSDDDDNGHESDDDRYSQFSDDDNGHESNNGYGLAPHSVQFFNHHPPPTEMPSLAENAYEP
jgi:hypothetical protein